MINDDTKIKITNEGNAFSSYKTERERILISINQFLCY